MKNTEEYERLKKIADDYMDGFADNSLSYSNSHHRSVAKQKYTSALREAEELGDEKEIKYIKDKIHFLDTA